MSGGLACHCKGKKDKDKNWRVLDRNCNYSAFSGYAETYSAYSSLLCIQCGTIWRSKAAYVGGIKTIHAWEQDVWVRKGTDALRAELEKREAV